MKALSILGSTGSIGVSTLEVVAGHPQRFRVVALTGGRNLERLAQQINRFRPALAAVISVEGAERLARLVDDDLDCEILHGVEGLIACACAAEADMVVSAIVGAAGLVPTMAAIEAGKDIALANKETLVVAGPLVMQRAADRGIILHPVDSEHSAIFQSLQGHRKDDVRKLILTASGGPFRRFRPAQLEQVTPQQALNHPNWDMGAKITIDSATMMNKGLEVIEARWLFDLPLESISVLVHPQSIVHSMVEYCDGSVIAQMGVADMKTPIAYALSCPERLPLKLKPLDLGTVGSLSFEPPDLERFPCLGLAYTALETGGTAPAAMNAANEIAVAAFLDGKLGFAGIPQLIDAVLQRQPMEALTQVEGAMQADLMARRLARELLTQFSLEGN